MSSREKILSSIKSNKPALVDLPVISLDAVIQFDDVVDQFKKTLESIGGRAIELSEPTQLKDIIASDLATGKYIIDNVTQSSNDHLASQPAAALASVERAYLKGTLAVAENAAVWLPESQMINRLLPFISEHLALVVEKKNIVATMHHAYQKINTASEGFGVFLAGPSKTADIEQSLVIGAHGARSLLVYLF
jgi:L-lactate dehydrogenase complex protein LldG